jgi:hypothetical protein
MAGAFAMVLCLGCGGSSDDDSQPADTTVDAKRLASYGAPFSWAELTIASYSAWLKNWGAYVWLRATSWL